MKMIRCLLGFLFSVCVCGGAAGQTLIEQLQLQGTPPTTFSTGLHVLVSGSPSAAGTPVLSLPITAFTSGLTGDETKVQGAAPVTVTGAGTVASPYVVGLTLAGLTDDEADNLLELGPDGLLYLDPSAVTAAANTDAQALGLVGNTLSLTNGGSVSLAAYLDNTDTQDLGLVGNTLSLTDGGSVSLAAYLDNTDAQDLSLSGTTLSLTGDGTSVSLAPFLQDLSLTSHTLALSGDGTTVNLAAYLDNTDTQDLSLSGDSLSLTDGGSVDLSAYDQAISLSGNTLSLSDGGSVSLAGYLDNTDAQNLSLSGDSLSLTGDATAVDLSKYAQDLTLSGSSLSLTDSAVDINLSSFNQDLSLTGNTLALSGDGTTVSLVPYLQDLSLSGDILSLSGDGTTVDLSGYVGGNDNLGNHVATTTLDLDNNAVIDGGAAQFASLEITNSISYDNTRTELLTRRPNGLLAIRAATSLLQDLSLSGNSLSLTDDGTPVDLSGYLDAEDWATFPAAQELEMVGENIEGAGAITGQTMRLAAANALVLETPPVTDNTEANLLVRDADTGVIQMRTVASLPVGNGGGVTATTTTQDSPAAFDVQFPPTVPPMLINSPVEGQSVVVRYTNGFGGIFTYEGTEWQGTFWETVGSYTPDPPDPEVNVVWAGPSGSPGAAGTYADPYELRDALDGTEALADNTTVKLKDGTYADPIASGHGTNDRGWNVAEANITIIGGETRYGARIQGGFVLQNGASGVRIENLYFYNPDPVPLSEPTAAGSPYPGHPAPVPDGWTEWGDSGVTMSGITAGTTEDVQIINCVIHGGRDGIESFKVEDLEIYGNIIYDYGWTATDRAHGHGLYLQNTSALAGDRHVVKHNLISTKDRGNDGATKGNYALHIYAESVQTQNMTIESNGVKGATKVSSLSVSTNDITWSNNVFEEMFVPPANGGGGNEFAFGNANPDSNLVSENNLYVNGMKSMETNGWTGLTTTGTRFMKIDPNWWRNTVRYYYVDPNWIPEEGLFIDYSSNNGTDEYRFWLNDYDANRANIVIVDGSDNGSVNILPADLDTLLSTNDNYSLYHYRNMLSPLQTGTYTGTALTLPITDTGDHTDLYVLFQNE